MNEVLKSALEYKAKGFNIIPLIPRSKLPAIEWDRYKRIMASDAEIRKWFDNEKNCNIGLVCGEISGNIEILDLDHDLLLTFFENIKTLQIRTQGGGYHLYFKSKNLSGNKIKLFGYPIDIRSEGGFGVAPPSKLNENEKWELAREDEILEIDNLIDFVAKHLPARISKTQLEELFKDKIDILKIIEKYIILQKQGRIYRGICPFHEDTDPSLIVYPKNFHCFGCGEHGDVIDFVQKIEKISKDEAIQKLEKISGINSNKPPKLDPILERYVLKLIEKWNIKTLLDTGELLTYENGVYKINGESKIQEILAKDFGLKIIKRVAECIHFIQALTSHDRRNFDNDKNIINVKNGLYDIENQQLFEHTPNHLSMIQIPINYMKNAKCPLTEHFINEIVKEKDRQTLWEIWSYILTPGNWTNQAFILYGDGANGKGVFMDTLAAFVGEDLFSLVRLDELEFDRFSSIELENKLVNISGESLVTNIKRIERLKAITGDEWISGQRKFGHPHKFRSTAKMIFGVNELPPLEDPKYAELRRLVLINFPFRFEIGKNADVHLRDKLRTTEEQEGQLRRAISHLDSLFTQKKVYENRTFERKEGMLLIGSNLVNEFLDECFDFEGYSNDKEILITNRCLYQIFEKFCREWKLIPFSKIKFGRELNISAHKIEKGFIVLNGIKMRVQKLKPLREFDFTQETSNDEEKIWDLDIDRTS